MAGTRLGRAGRAAGHSRSTPWIAQRNLSQVGHIMNGGITMFEILDSEVIVVSAFAIDLVIGRDHVIGIERGDNVIDHVFLRQP